MQPDRGYVIINEMGQVVIIPKFMSEKSLESIRRG